MSDKSNKMPPPAAWRRLGFAAVALLVGAVTAISMISAGVFDPQPAGDQRSRHALSAEEISAGARYVAWLEDDVPPGDATLRLTAEHSSGETDIGYGLLLGRPHRYLAAAVSPTGYVAVWQSEANVRTTVVPWQAWPHVRMGSRQNELQIDKVGGEVTVRINRELLWRGAWKVGDSRAGVYGESFGEAAVVDYQELVRFSP